MDIKGKKISILGAVRSGVAAAVLAKKMGAVPFVSDSGSKEKLENEITILENEGIEFEIGRHTNTIYDSDKFRTAC